MRRRKVTPYDADDEQAQQDFWSKVRSAWAALRDPVIVMTALGLIAAEALRGVSHPERLVIYTGMLGLPLVLQRDRKD